MSSRSRFRKPRAVTLTDFNLGPTPLPWPVRLSAPKIPNMGFGEIFIFACEECDVVPKVFV